MDHEIDPEINSGQTAQDDGEGQPDDLHAPGAVDVVEGPVGSASLKEPSDVERDASPER